MFTLGVSTHDSVKPLGLVKSTRLDRVISFAWMEGGRIRSVLVNNERDPAKAAQALRELADKIESEVGKQI